MGMDAVMIGKIMKIIRIFESFKEGQFIDLERQQEILGI